MEKIITSDFPAGTQPADGYDRLKELKDFDDSKVGVKGLVDAGIQKLPRIFIRPPELLAQDSLVPNGSHIFQVPIIDLQGLENKERRKEIINEVRQASESWGFFHLVNHGLPSTVMEEMIKGSQRFFEQDTEVKKQFYTRDVNKRVKYNSNFNLFTEEVADWRDTLGCFLRKPDLISPHEVPETCREIIFEYLEYATSLSNTLYELLSEALGLEPDYLKCIGGSTWCTCACNYYPACPEPELTLGTNNHFDPFFLTILIQDGLGGLQVFHQNHWVDVSPIPGSLLVNIGYLLQILSNGKFKGEQHRVLASHMEPRTSVAFFFRTLDSSTLGPIKELLSEDNPPKYEEKLLKDYVHEIYSTGMYKGSHCKRGS